MINKTNKLTRFARHLRKNSTNAERLLWRQVRNRQLAGFKFRRQFVIGRYIVDFCCLEQKLVVELDGGQHVDNVEYDDARTTYLESLGYRVIRFWNDDVLVRTSDVLEQVLLALAPHPNPLPKGERE